MLTSEIIAAHRTPDGQLLVTPPEPGAGPEPPCVAAVRARAVELGADSVVTPADTIVLVATPEPGWPAGLPVGTRVLALAPQGCDLIVVARTVTGASEAGIVLVDAVLASDLRPGGVCIVGVRSDVPLPPVNWVSTLPDAQSPTAERAIAEAVSTHVLSRAVLGYRHDAAAAEVRRLLRTQERFVDLVATTTDAELPETAALDAAATEYTRTAQELASVKASNTWRFAVALRGLASPVRPLVVRLRAMARRGRRR